MVNFDICQFLVTPGPFEYFGQNQGSSENDFFLDEGVMGCQSGLEVLGEQVPRLYGGTIFGGVQYPWGIWQDFESEGSIFRLFKFTLKPPYTVAIGNFFSAIWTLPIGIFCQIWSQDSLRHLLGPLLVNFW